jgi:outer membrane lipoprotein LolB
MRSGADNLRQLGSVLIAGFLMLSGCASSNLPTFQNGTVSSATQANIPEWQGRLSLRIQSDPATSMSAGFLLRGDSTHGRLDLHSPLGTTLAALHWSPNAVHLQQGGQLQRFDSMDELTEQVTGAALPVNALFDWLHGIPSATQGWQADLSQLPQGLLIAQRVSPTPTVQLRIKLD